MPFADLGDVRLFYTDDGDASAGETLLLVHGWGGDSNSWSFHLPQLTASHRVIAPDLRGHGRSSAPAYGYRPSDMAGDLARLLELRSTGPVVAIGHSMGAQVVTALAVQFPGRVSALVAVDPAYGATGAEIDDIPRRLAALRRDGAAEAARQIAGAFTPTSPAWLATWHTRQILGTPGHVLAEAYAGMSTEPDAFGIRPATEAYLARRRCRSLSLWSFPAMGEWERSLPAPEGSEVVTWTGAGHYLHEERPTDFVDLLLQWLYLR